MNIGVLKVKLHLPESTSLKDKRQVLRSIIERLNNRFGVSVAEVDDNDRRSLATLGICFTSNDSRHTDRILSKVKSFIVDSHYDAEIINIEQEIIPF